jgi:hypothetical protein
VRRPTDAEVTDWVERHDLRITSVTDARAAFEDAATICRACPATPQRAGGPEGRQR